MELSTKQIELLRTVKEHGPGTPEALAAFQEYEDDVRRQEEQARLEPIIDRQGARIATLEKAVKDLGQRLGSQAGHE